jgi:hypothetical protein
MLVEIATDELSVFRPPVECVGRRVDAEKPAAAADEIRERRALVRAHWQLTGCEEHHGAVPLQVFGREDGEFLGWRDLEAGRRADPLQDVLRSRNDLVAVTGGMGEVENTGGAILRARRERPCRRRAAEQRDELASSQLKWHSVP